MKHCWAVLTAAGAAYTVGPQAAASWLGLAAIRHSRGGPSPLVPPRLALTFDDGPLAGATELVLELLARYSARATFFMTGERADAAPDLARMVVEAGHEPGNHTLTHRHLWTAGPEATWREMVQASTAIERATGRWPRFFRPPWGIFNLASLAYCRALGMLPVLWSVRTEGFFWRPGAEEMAAHVLQRVRGGGIINLHDAGPGGPSAGSGSPAGPPRAEPRGGGQASAVLTALPRILSGLADLGYRCVTLSDLLAA